MVNIEMLQALHGDSFILHCHKGENSGLVVVDGGPSKKSRKVVEKLDKLGTIDLMVLTHFDDDHIGGILRYVKKHEKDIPFPVKKMWLNCAYQSSIPNNSNISFREAMTLADELSEINIRLKANDMAQVKWKTPIHACKNMEYSFADFTILSPTESIKEINDNNYHNDIHANIGANHVHENQMLMESLDKLAMQETYVTPTSKQEIINESSISFIVDCDNFKALMLGDSYPQTIIKSLKQLGYSETKPLEVDYVKISHHGSMNNTSCDLLDMIKCDKYLISTNGGHGSSTHPDRETIAKLICHKNRDYKHVVTLFLNYPLKDIEKRGYKFINDGEAERFNFVIKDNVQSIE